jgi:hypothetical protein
VNASDVRDREFFLSTEREDGPKMLTMGTSLSDGVTATVFVSDAHAPRKLHSVAWILYCWPSMSSVEGIELGGVIV